MEKNNKYIESISKLERYCNDEDYRGYSLYDSHNSPFPFQKLGKTISFYSNQIVKRSPINFRPLLGIKKEINPKGMGLFLNAYCNLKKAGKLIDIDSIDTKINFFFEWLRSNPSKGYSGQCWGYNYFWPRGDGSVVPRYTPTSVVTGFNSRALLKYYLLTKDDKAKELIISCENFIKNDIPKTTHDDGICFSYFPHTPNVTVNASLLAAEVLAYSDFVKNESSNHEILKNVLDFTVSRQNDDGSWYYAYDLKTGKPKKQIDFHQGYVLESIYRICKYSKIDERIYEKSISKGLDFYYHKQFDKWGRSLWRYPTKWPVDIHNQCQGILTFTIFKKYNKNYLDFAKKITSWTINNMQNRKGYFYYQKWPFITSKVAYMRWNQAWMFVALSRLILELDKNNK